MKDNILIGVSILLVIGIAIAVYFNIGLSNENDGLADDTKKLSEELEDLEDDLEASQDEATTLEADIGALTDEITTLTSDIEDTTTLIADLTTAEGDLELFVEKFDDYGICDFGGSLDLSLFLTGEYDKEMGLIVLILWYFFNFGEPIDADGEILWEDDPDSPDFILFQADSEDWDGFLIFYDSGIPAGIFFIDHQCWLELD